MALLEPRAPGKTLHHLTGMRFVLILWVVMFHLTASADKDTNGHDIDKLVAADPNIKGRENFLDRIAQTLVLSERVHLAVAGYVEPVPVAVTWARPCPPCTPLCPVLVPVAVAPALTLRPRTIMSDHSFIVMSGFVTQWALGARSVGRGRQLALYLFKRVDRALLTVWLTMGVDAVLLGLHGQLRNEGGTVSDGVLVTACFLQVAPWWLQWPSGVQYDLAKCPNAPAWTIGALLPQWVLYPLVMQPAIQATAVHAGDAGLCLLLALLLCVSLGGAAASPRHAYFFPPAWTADFMAGGVVATLAARHAPPVDGSASHTAPRLASRAWIAADVAIVALLAIAIFPTFDPSYTATSLAACLRLHGSVPLFLLFYYGSAVGSTPGFFASRLARPLYRSLGTYALEVYLLHFPINHIGECSLTSHHCTEPAGRERAPCHPSPLSLMRNVTKLIPPPSIQSR